MFPISRKCWKQKKGGKKIKSFKLFGVAGSGKTTFCMNAVRYLTHNDGETIPQEVSTFLHEVDQQYQFNDVCFCSFTRPALKSIKEKLRNNGIFLGNDHYFRTLHSLTWRLVGFSGDNMINNKDLKEFFEPRNIKVEFEEDEKSEGSEIVELYNNAITTYCKSLNDISDRELREVIDLSGRDMDLKLDVTTKIDVVRKYQEWKVKKNKKDYIDSLLAVLVDKIDIPCKVLIVDEAQDLSNIQIEIIKLWTEYHDREIFIISGDDDQTVHEWAGAKPDYLVNVNFPSMKKHILNHSYRCPKKVCSLCNDILRGINFRQEKWMTSSKEEGDVHYLTTEGIHLLIKRFALSYKNNKRTFLLFRTNRIKRGTAKIIFEHSDMPFGYINSSDKSGFWSLKFISVCNALNKIEGGGVLTKTEVTYLFGVLPTTTCLKYGMKTKVWDSDKDKYTADEVLNMTKIWSPQRTLDSLYSPSNSKKDIVHFIEYIKIRKNFDREVIEKNKKYRDKLLRISKIYDVEYDSEDREWYINHRVRLGTYHSSKGLGAEDVYVFEGTSDYFKVVNDSERRCFYVALSRTEQELYIIPTLYDIENQKPYLQEAFENDILKNCIVE